MAGTVARPKVYIDYISYFRATGLGLGAVETGGSILQDYSDILTYNPSNTKTFTPRWDDTSMKFKIFMGDGTGEASKLVQSINYGAFLNHNAEDFEGRVLNINGMKEDNSASSLNTSETGGTSGLNGFRLFNLDVSRWNDNNCFGLIFTSQQTGTNEPLRLGSVIAGRSYTFPHNANLSMNINYDADGIRSSRTLGGHDIVDVNYYKQPDWDGRPPFVATNASGLSATSHIGRRSWALTFSFLTATDTFPQDMGENFMFDNYFADNGSETWTNHTTDNITSHFMTLTMNGQLGFLFQPDNTKNTFAWCKLRSNSFSVQQSAPNLYTCKMTFDETW